MRRVKKKTILSVDTQQKSEDKAENDLMRLCVCVQNDSLEIPN